MGKFWSRKEEKKVMHLTGVEATATRAVIGLLPGQELPRLLFMFKVRTAEDKKTREQFDYMEVEMDLYQAAKFIDQAMSSYQAAAPPVPGYARRTQFGE